MVIRNLSIPKSRKIRIEVVQAVINQLDIIRAASLKESNISYEITHRNESVSSKKWGNMENFEVN